MRWWTAGALALGVGAAAAAAGLALWEPLAVEAAALRPAPAYDVRIVRDRWGVPHIFGRRDRDVGYGLAYAHAEDDFSTLQEVLASTRSRLGAITGADGAKTDYVAHLLGVRDTVDRRYARDLSPATRALVEAYADGLNRYAEKHPQEVRLAKLFPVTGKDVVAGFTLRSPFFFGLDAQLAALVEGRDPPADRPPVAPNGFPTGSPADEKGSNAWAVAPRRSADGVTRLVSNAHQPWTGGVAWYEVVVHSGEGWDFAGALFPGAPMVLLGHNRTLGWTNTVNRPDLIDVYKLVLDDSGTRYRFDGRWLPLIEKQVWLRAKVGPFTLPVRRSIFRSAHGPVVKNDRGAFAIRYAAFDQVRNVEQYYRLNKARDFAEWRRIMAMQAVAATNFVYADAAGNIAMVYNALFPARAPGFDWHGVLPGDTSKAVWRRYAAFDRVPMLVNPPSGYVMNANNTPFVATSPADDLKPSAFSPLLGIEVDVTNRARRAIELMDADPSITRAELEAIKYDTGYSRSGYPGAWMDAVLALDPGGDKQIVNAQALLRTWDWNLDGNGRADALALQVMRPAARTSYRREPRPDPREELVNAVAATLDTFGRLDPPLGALLRLKRGGVDLPLTGGPDTLRAMAAFDEPDDGRLLVRHGDSFVMFVEWDRAGSVSSRSIQPYGAATTRPDSPHYADQARLFVRRQLKPVWFEEADLRQHMAREYRP